MLDQSIQSSLNEGMGKKGDIKVIEQAIYKKMTESVDQLGELIKTQAKNQKKLQ